MRVARLALTVALVLLGLACLSGPPESRSSVTDLLDEVGESFSPTPRMELPTPRDAAELTEADIDLLIQALQPVIEAEAGATFHTTPKGLLGTADALREVLRSETRSVLGKIYDIPEPVIERMASAVSGELPGLLGKYASSTGAVYLVPSGIAALQTVGATPDDVNDLMVLLLVHELVHALQDQVARLDPVIEGLEDRDHFDGFRGITEGHANWVTLRVARAIGREEAFWDLSRAQGWGPEGLIEPGAFPIFMLYGQGMTLCEHHAEAGGTDRLWELVREPPRSTTMLFRPERYAPSLPERPDLRGVFRGVEDVLTRGIPWVPADSNLGEGVLRSQVIGLSPERVDQVLGSIDWGYERRMYSEGGPNAGPRQALVQVVRFERSQDAKALVELLTDGLEAQAQARTRLEADHAAVLGSEAARTWTVDAVPYDKVEGDAVVRRIVGPTTASGARRSIEEEQALWVVRDVELVVISVSGFRPGNRLDRAVELVFEQLEAREDHAP
ncbi:MAG: hypothetical protein EA397_06280 [Deltaproteobacteria bacterium]|nr:MAG: hypothetical protein EA397_06280 [Deltaproteobacteria bacterium]